jgi:hypothetical protein
MDNPETLLATLGVQVRSKKIRAYTYFQRTVGKELVILYKTDALIGF